MTETLTLIARSAAARRGMIRSEFWGLNLFGLLEFRIWNFPRFGVPHRGAAWASTSTVSRPAIVRFTGKPLSGATTKFFTM